MLKHLCLLAGIALLAVNLPADSPPAGTTDLLIQSERQQQLLRANIETVSTQLRALIDDYRRNGITGDEIKTLQTIAGVIAHLTDTEIQRVVDLQKLRGGQADASGAAGDENGLVFHKNWLVIKRNKRSNIGKRRSVENLQGQAGTDAQ